MPINNYILIRIMELFLKSFKEYVSSQDLEPITEDEPAAAPEQTGTSNMATYEVPIGYSGNPIELQHKTLGLRRKRTKQ